MNRIQFFAELKNSLIKTTKEIAFPILDEKVEKLEDVTDQIVGVKWVRLEGINPNFFKGVREHYLNGKSILLYSDGSTLKAYDKVCIECDSLSNWISYEKKLKCFNCEKSLQLENESGDLACKHYYTKEKNGEWFIGV